MIQEEDVTTTNIVEIFEQAFMEVSEKNGNRFSVKGTNFPFLIGVRIDAERKAIRFADYNRLHRTTAKEAAALCNEANGQYILARFYSFMHQDAIMAATGYDMSYEKGIIPFQIISNFRLFEKIAGSVVSDLFKDHLRP